MNSARKHFLSHEEMIEYLKDNKKIIVSEKYKDIFSERNYVSIINPFKTLFSYGKKEDKTHYYKNNTDIETIINLVSFDDAFSKSLYTLIGTFERLLKEEVITQICLMYINDGDYECVRYIDEIKEHILNGGPLPRFAINMNSIPTKTGFVENPTAAQQKIFLLARIYQIATGKNCDGTIPEDRYKSNRLIKHYISTQGGSPLWVLPSALTLWEVNVLCLGMPVKNIVEVMTAVTKKSANISEKDIFAFSGRLEAIRNMRNTINHYEPIFPALCEDYQYRPEKLISILNMLLNVDDSSLFKLPEYSVIDKIPKTQYNSKMKSILSIMKDYTK